MNLAAWSFVLSHTFSFLQVKGIINSHSIQEISVAMIIICTLLDLAAELWPKQYYRTQIAYPHSQWHSQIHRNKSTNKVRKKNLINFKESGAWLCAAFKKHVIKIKHIPRGHWLQCHLFMGLNYVLIWDLKASTLESKRTEDFSFSWLKAYHINLVSTGIIYL